MIYLDANATSRLRPEAAAVFAEFAEGGFELGNPSSVHALGRKGRARVAAARAALLQFARFDFGAAATAQKNDYGTVIFTSGGTESCNTLVFGLLDSFIDKSRLPGRIVASAIEHAAIDEPLRLLEQSGWEVVRVRPQSNGIVRVEDFAAAAAPQNYPNTAMVCLMGANNETGAVQPIEQIARRLRADRFSGVIVSDLTQAFGKALIDLPALFDSGINAVSLSGHKIGAATGIGAAIIAGGSHNICFPFHPLLRGGPQEQRMRAGTENLVGIASLGAVATAFKAEIPVEIRRISDLREDLWRGLISALPELVRLTPPAVDYDTVTTFSDQLSLSNTLTFRVPGCRGDDLVVALDLAGVAASTGSACASGKQTVSPVLVASGLSPAEAREVIRLSLDWDCDRLKVEQAIGLISSTIARAQAYAGVNGRSADHSEVTAGGEARGVELAHGGGR